MEFSVWLDSTWVSWAMSGGWPWLWPACETLHFMGLALLVGAVGVLDLRMIGMAPGLPLASVQKLMPWGVLGFIVNLVTGALFFIGEPHQYVTNLAFLMKMLFIAGRGSTCSCSTRRDCTGASTRWGPATTRRLARGLSA